MNWLRPLFSRRHRCDELSATIREHLEEKIAELTTHWGPKCESASAFRHGAHRSPQGGPFS